MNADPKISEKGKKSTFGVVFLTIFLDMVGFSVLFPLFPEMLDYYLEREAHSGGGIVTDLVAGVQSLSFVGSDPQSVFRFETVIFGGALGSLYAVLQFVFAPIWGRLSDYLGRRKVLIYTLAGTAFGYGLWIFAGNFWVLVFSRVIGGIASGNLSVATAAIADVTSRESRSKGMALVGIAFGLGFILGPALGGYASTVTIADPSMATFALNPFSAAAIISLSLALLNWLWIFFFFKETLLAEKRKSKGKAKSGIFQLGEVANSNVRDTCLVYLFYMISFSGMEFTLTFLAVERFGYSPVDLGNMFILIGLTLIFVQGFFVRTFVGRIGEKNMALIGIVLGFTAFMIISQSDETPLFYLGLFLMSAGVALISPTLTALTSLHSGDGDQGFHLGIFRSSGSMARACGPMLAGLAYYAFGSEISYVFGAILLIFPLLIMFRIERPKIERAKA